jgi:hypothetical protein
MEQYQHQFVARNFYAVPTVIHILISVFEQSICTPMCIACKVYLTHWKVSYLIGSDKWAGHAEVVSERILCQAGQITGFFSTAMQ